MSYRDRPTLPAVMLLAVLLGVLPALAFETSAGAAPSSRAAVGQASPNALESFGDCESLLAHLKATASAHVGPYGFGRPFYGVFNDAGALSSRPVFAAADSQASGGDGSDGSAFSGTNNQEAGVDEADLVKTDGRRMLVLRGGTLTTIDVSKPAKPVRRARLPLSMIASNDAFGGTDPNGGSGSMLLEGDRALVLLPHWQAFPASEAQRVGAAPGLAGETVTDVVMVSIADLARPRVLDRVTMNGDVLAARLVNGAARLAIRSIPFNLAFVAPQSSRGFAAATEANKRIINQSTIADWLPSIQRGNARTPAVECPDVRAPVEFAGIGMTTIHTLAMTDRITPSSASLQADSDTAYASADHLYVTAAAWVDPATYNDPSVWDGLATKFQTAIHDFAINGPKAAYVASGKVRGHPLNRWAMSEKDSRLRIATTDGPTWPRPGESGPPASESFMTVLAPKGAALGQVGQVGGIGKGEQIRAVRYDGNTAYTVTFRQIDPFYVLDLSNPARPAVVGELKVSGYSGYLHPTAPGRVLGVGAEADSTGRITGAKVTLFDVSNPRQPRALGSYSLPGSYTQIEVDAKAFLWWAPTKLAVVPMQGWGPFALNGALGLRVTDRSIAPVGSVVHTDPRPKGYTPCRPLSADEVQSAGLRGLVAIDCTPSQPVTVVGFFCTPNDKPTFEQRYSRDFPLASGHTLGVCSLDRDQPLVDRSVVVGNRLITLSPQSLVSSDLKTLTQGVFVSL